MIRSILLGLWATAVTLTALYAGTRLGAGPPAPEPAAAKYHGKLTQLKLKPLSVPAMEDGRITGYVVARLTLTVPADTLKHLSIKPDAFALDAAFRAIYAGGALDRRTLGKESWERFGEGVKTLVNGRYGEPVVHDVLVDEIGWVPMDQVRSGPRQLAPAAVGDPPRGKSKGPAH